MARTVPDLEVPYAWREHPDRSRKCRDNAISTSLDQRARSPWAVERDGGGGEGRGAAESLHDASFAAAARAAFLGGPSAAGQGRRPAPGGHGLGLSHKSPRGVTRQTSADGPLFGSSGSNGNDFEGPRKNLSSGTLARGLSGQTPEDQQRSNLHRQRGHQSPRAVAERTARTAPWESSGAVAPAATAPTIAVAFSDVSSPCLPGLPRRARWSPRARSETGRAQAPWGTEDAARDNLPSELRAELAMSPRGRQSSPVPVHDSSDRSPRAASPSLFDRLPRASAQPPAGSGSPRPSSPSSFAPVETRSAGRETFMQQARSFDYRGVHCRSWVW